MIISKTTFLPKGVELPYKVKVEDPKFTVGIFGCFQKIENQSRGYMGILHVIVPVPFLSLFYYQCTFELTLNYDE